MNKLRQAILIAMTGSAIALAPSTASAALGFNTTFTDNITTFGWNGLNNGYQGWGHNSNWYNFQVNSVGNVEILVTGNTSTVQPAFTVWSAGSYGSSAIGPWGTSYNQTANSAFNTSFIGFADNSNDPYTISHFGSGPSAVAAGGAPALPGTSAIVGTNNAGDHYAELIFPNAVAGSWYFFALGGSGNASGLGGGQVSVFVGPASVPLPSAVWLFGSVLAGLGLTGIRGKRSLPIA